LVDLHKLESTSLKTYRRVFQLGEVDAAAPKAQLVTAVQRHFSMQVSPGCSCSHHVAAFNAEAAVHRLFSWRML
jgi:hypothetical protein